MLSIDMINPYEQKLFGSSINLIYKSPPIKKVKDHCSGGTQKMYYSYPEHERRPM